MMLPIALESGAGAAPYLVAAAILILFLALMGALLAFGKGRDHS